MIKVSQETIASVELDHPGITEQIWRFENMVMPPCPYCGSGDIASVQVGIIGRTIDIATATTKFHLIANAARTSYRPYFCLSCRKYFKEKTRKQSVREERPD